MQFALIKNLVYFDYNESKFYFCQIYYFLNIMQKQNFMFVM